MLDLAVVLGLVLAGLDAAALGRFAQSGDVAGALGAAICALGCLWVAR